MTIKPCSRCPLKSGCVKRLGLLKSVKGLGLTSIKFRCDLLAAHLIPGTWCEAHFFYICNDATGQTEEGTMRACVARIRPDGKVVVWVPPTETKWLESVKTQAKVGRPLHPDEWQGEKIEWVAVWPDKLKPIPGAPNEPHCPKCGSPVDAIGKNSGCSTCSPPEDYR